MDGKTGISTVSKSLSNSSFWQQLVLTTTHDTKEEKKSKAFSWRLYSNYHRLNSIIFLDYYHISNIQDFTSQLYGATIFSNIDPIQVCHQILVEKIFFKKSWIAIAGHFRLFEFLHLLFKLQKYCRNIPMFSESTSMIRLP